MEQPKPKKTRQKPPEKKNAPKDIYAARKRKKRRKVLQQGIWLLLLAIIILILYQRRDSWIPKLETIGQRHQSRHIESAAEDGRFPIWLYGDTRCQLGTAGGELILLTDSYLQVYEPDGTPVASRQHTYGNAMLQTAGGYAMVYESGGTHFRLETPSKTRFEKTMSDPIVFARVSANGMTAVVTTAETCACRLYVFNVKGQQIYERSCVERLVDASFNADETGCYAVSIHAADGGMKSVVHSYDFTMINDVWTSQPLDTLAISVYNTSGGDVFLLGDTMCCYLTAAGTVRSSYTYSDKLECGAFSGENAALLFSNDEKRLKSLVLLDGTTNLPAVRVYDKDVMAIAMVPESGAVLVQQRKQLETVAYSGTVLRTEAMADSYEGFLRIGENLYLRSYDHIDTMQYELIKTEK